MNWLASKHNLKMAGRSFGWKKNYSLTVTVSSEPWWPHPLRQWPFFYTVEEEKRTPSEN
jgi:hypothetical protein